MHERGYDSMGLLDRQRIVQLAVNGIRPNPAQPRQIFDEKELAELSQSIQANGLLQPLLVRRTKEGYELIAGERRLRASLLAGLKTVPCLVNDCTDSQSAVLAMTENLQRQNLQIFEEAEGIRRLIDEWNVTQEEAAQRLGKSQSTLANKLRLLRLGPEEREIISKAGLTERHARALLRLSEEQERRGVLEKVVKNGWNVQQTEEWIGHVLEERDQEKKPKSKRTIVVKDVRIFMNTIQHAIDTMKLSGINAQTLRSETDEYIECVVRIPKKEALGGKRPA